MMNLNTSITSNLPFGPIEPLSASSQVYWVTWMSHLRVEVPPPSWKTTSWHPEPLLSRIMCWSLLYCPQITGLFKSARYGHGYIFNTYLHPLTTLWCPCFSVCSSRSWTNWTDFTPRPSATYIHTILSRIYISNLYEYKASEKWEMWDVNHRNFRLPDHEDRLEKVVSGSAKGG